MAFSVLDCDGMLSGRQAAFVQNNEPQMNHTKKTDYNINKHCLLGCNTIYLHFGGTCCMPAHLRRWYFFSQSVPS